MSGFERKRDAETYLDWALKRIRRLELIYDGSGSPIDREIHSLVKAVKLLAWAIRRLLEDLEGVIGARADEKEG